MPTMAEQLAADPDFQAFCEGKVLAEVKRNWTGFESPGTIARAYRICTKDAKSFALTETTPETTKPMNDSLLEDVGKPLPIDDAITDWTPPAPMEDDEDYPPMGHSDAEAMGVDCPKGEDDIDWEAIKQEEQQALLDATLDMAKDEDPMADAEGYDPNAYHLSPTTVGKDIVHMGDAVYMNNAPLTANVNGIPQWPIEVARHKLSAIKGNELKQQKDLLEFKLHRGHLALGYKNEGGKTAWENFLETEFEINSRQHFEYLTKCGETFDFLVGHFEQKDLRKLKNDHLYELAKLKEPEKVREAMTLALARVETTVYKGEASRNNGKFTGKIFKDVVEELRAPTMTEKANKAIAAPVVQPGMPELPFEDEKDPYEEDEMQEMPLSAPENGESPQGEQSSVPHPFPVTEAQEAANVRHEQGEAQGRSLDEVITEYANDIAELHYGVNEFADDMQPIIQTWEKKLHTLVAMAKAEVWK